ncbi:MAG: dual specificity protein phosphatase [Candidatus Paceibacterota bacterium]|jgi:protein tyrosine phosphatase
MQTLGTKSFKDKLHNAFHGKDLDYDYITDGIYIGTNQCCMFALHEMLKKEGITADISLEDTRVDQPFGVETYTWIPVKDGTPPSDDQLAFGVSILEGIASQKKNVYVHCQNGHGRAATLVAAYLIKKGKTPDEAIDFIKSKRPTVHLTENQMNALKRFWEK